MALSAREQAELDAIARRIRAEEPALAARLAAHDEDADADADTRSARELWPVALIAVCLAVFTVALALSTGSPDPLTQTVIR
ncbi:DUF3040 domain-containing protein [Nonomuraea longicatena]|uniref:DUF3040 domain-containing protein n=1 Tax=Nonomuraea longicatena TaxID=83682 RepID=A0ABN1PPF9_9ACTN